MGRGMILAVVTGALLPASTVAATITPTVTTDDLDVNGNCTLREAVQAARNNAAVDACPAGQAAPATDTIVLGSSQYRLSIPGALENDNATGDLDIAGGPVVIRGQGSADGQTFVIQNHLVDEALQDRAIDVDPVSGDTDLTLEALTVTDGDVDALAGLDARGGNIRIQQGQTVLRNVRIKDGRALQGGGIMAASSNPGKSLTIVDSLVGGASGGNLARRGGGLSVFGGIAVQIARSSFIANVANVPSVSTFAQGAGILNQTTSGIGSIAIADSLISGNIATHADAGSGLSARGGGIHSEGPLTIRGSLIAGNRVNAAGTNLATNLEVGGGVSIQSATAPTTIVNTTIFDNEAGHINPVTAFGGGIYVGAGTATLNHVTFSQNAAEQGGDSIATGGGDGGVTLGRSIVPGFIPLGDDPCDEGALQIVSAGFNAAVSNDLDCGYVATDTTSGALGTVPGGPQDNGGPTRTIAILSTGTAYNKVPAASCGPAGGVDQRGFPRPFQGQPCDAGAYELLSCPSTTTPLNSPGGVPACLLPPPQPQPQPGPAAPTARCAGKAATVVGTDGPDVLRGTPKRDVIAALGGKDTVRGLGGNDLICGGAGNDRLFGGAGKDRLLGQGGRDKLVGGKGKDLCKGGGGKDRASGCEKRRSI